jgi:hypothetical protein
MSDATLDDYVDLGAADDRPVRVDRRSAVVTVADLDVVTRELLAVARDASTAERSAAYARAAYHYESALKDRLSLDYCD